jgi:YgiT-type zinc finger domain-containing protein
MDGLTFVHFERGEMQLVVNKVPARVCHSCGEAYVEEDVAVLLLREAEAVFAAGALDSVLDFGSIRPDDKIHS